MATPYACTHLTEVDSTQDEARDRFGGTPELVIADRQRQGRGRLGRHWDQAPRALAASLAFEPSWPETTWPRLTLVAGLAALDALPSQFGHDSPGPGRLGLSWPNDLYRDGRKVGGILVEAGDGVVVAGLGVNLWWPDPPPDRAGLYHKDPGPDAAMDLARAWATSLLGRLAKGPEEWGKEEAEAASVIIGQRVVLADGAEATAVGLDDDGSLVVEEEGRRWSVRSGPVSIDDGEIGEQ